MPFLAKKLDALQLGIPRAQNYLVNLICCIQSVLNCFPLDWKLRLLAITKYEVEPLTVTYNAGDVILNANVRRPLVVLNFPFGHFCQSEGNFVLQLPIDGVV